MRRGGPGGSSQLLGAGRLGLPGRSPPSSVWAHRASQVLALPNSHLTRLYLALQPCNSLGLLLGFSITGENTFIGDSRPRLLSPPKMSRKPEK